MAQGQARGFTMKLPLGLGTLDWSDWFRGVLKLRDNFFKRKRRKALAPSLNLPPTYADNFRPVRQYVESAECSNPHIVGAIAGLLVMCGPATIIGRISEIV